MKNHNGRAVAFAGATCTPTPRSRAGALIGCARSIGMEIPKQSIRGPTIHLRAITGPAAGRRGPRGG
jgi:hypothetical protein